MPSNPTLGNTITPLPNSQKIVNPDGTPNDYFIRWAQERSQDISVGITYVQLLEVLAEISIIAGVGLTGGGPIDDNVTLDLEDTAVSPGTYGDASNVAQFTVDQQGRLTFADNIPLAAPPSTLEIDENGTPVVTAATKINFIGATVTQPVAGEADVTIPAPPPPPAPFDLTVADGGGTVETFVDTITFTGAGVTVTNPATGAVTVDIPGGGSGSSAIYAPVVTGALPGPDPIAGGAGNFIMARVA